MIEQKEIDELYERLEFGGGPKSCFKRVGKLQLTVLLELGLKPYHKVLDFGCGAIRGGYWLIHFLNSDCYFGIEGRQNMVEAGKEILLENDTLEHKRPRFDYNTDFDFEAFDETFDYVIARSVWTHAPKVEIGRSLDAFKSCTNKNGRFISSIFLDSSKDYQGQSYKGTNADHLADGKVFHDGSKIQDLCQERGLKAHLVAEDYFNINHQDWLVIDYD